MNVCVNVVENIPEGQICQRKHFFFFFLYIIHPEHTKKLEWQRNKNILIHANTFSIMVIFNIFLMRKKNKYKQGSISDCTS